MNERARERIDGRTDGRTDGWMDDFYTGFFQILTLFSPAGGFCTRRLWTLITLLIFNETLPNLATFSKIYLATI